MDPVHQAKVERFIALCRELNLIPSVNDSRSLVFERYSKYAAERLRNAYLILEVPYRVVYLRPYLVMRGSTVEPEGTVEQSTRVCAKSARGVPKALRDRGISFTRIMSIERV